MNKFKTLTALMLLLAIGIVGCGKSEAERHRLSKKEKAFAYIRTETTVR